MGAGVFVIIRHMLPQSGRLCGIKVRGQRVTVTVVVLGKRERHAVYKAAARHL